jgi:hypothetical protein
MEKDRSPQCRSSRRKAFSVVTATVTAALVAWPTVALSSVGLSPASAAPTAPALAAPALAAPALAAPALAAATTATTVPATSQLASAVVSWEGAKWKAVAVQHGPGTPIALTVSRYSAGAWHAQGAVRLTPGGAGPDSGDLGGAGQELFAAGLTGAKSPDFVVVTRSSSTVPWFSVVSASGGRWHLVPVEFGYRPVPGVPAEVSVLGRLLRVEVDGQGYAPYTAVDWFSFDGTTFSPTNPAGTPPPCDVQDLGYIPADNSQGVAPPSEYACADGWALLVGTFQLSPYLELLNWQKGAGWQEVSTGAQVDDAPMWFGLPMPTFEALAHQIGGAVAPVVAAAAVVARYPASAIEGYGAELSVVGDSGVVYQFGQDWMAVVSPPAPSTLSGILLTIFRWDGTVWAQQAAVRTPDFFGDLDSSTTASAVEPEALTGGPAPDFTLSGSGADTHWFAVDSDIGGRWQGVPFDYGSKPVLAIDEAQTSGGLVEGELDACGCALGPESQLWYEYSPVRHEFLPTDPPGPPAPCTAAVMHQAVAVADVRFSAVACADGWAVATGTDASAPVPAATGAAAPVKAVALFEQEGTAWQAVNLVNPPSVNAAALASLVANYLVPGSVLAKLEAGLHIA